MVVVNHFTTALAPVVACAIVKHQEDRLTNNAEALAVLRDLVELDDRFSSDLDSIPLAIEWEAAIDRARALLTPGGHF